MTVRKSSSRNRSRGNQRSPHRKGVKIAATEDPPKNLCLPGFRSYDEMVCVGAIGMACARPYYFLIPNESLFNSIRNRIDGIHTGPRCSLYAGLFTCCKSNDASSQGLTFAL